MHLPGEAWAARVRLAPAQRRHLIDVLRLNPGDQVEVFDGDGGLCQGVLERDDQGWCLQLGPKTTRSEAAGTWLGCALLKGRKLDDVVRMATEIGVTGIQPLVSARCVSRPDTRRIKDRRARWQTIAAQAARQSGRSRVPQVAGLLTLEEVLSQPPPGPGVMLHERAGSLLVDWLAGLGGGPRFLLVGPEGGFNEEEVDLAAGAGLGVAGLGLPVLRAPTAAVVAAAFACVSEGCSLDFHKAVE